MMSTLRFGIVIVAVWAMGLVNPQVGAAVPLGTDFSYQAQLKLDGVPLNDTADFEFSLYDADSNGLLVAGPITVSNVAVVDGLLHIGTTTPRRIAFGRLFSVRAGR